LQELTVMKLQRLYKLNHDIEDIRVSAERNIKTFEHVFPQLQNKPWAVLYVACIFFYADFLGVLAFMLLTSCSSRLVASVI
jgi:hypothetical protein